MATLFSAVNLIGEPAARATELLWQDAMMHLEATNHEVLLPANVAELIGAANIELLADRLSTLLNKEVRLVEDDSINVLRIVPFGKEESKQILPVDNDEFKAISRAVHEAAFIGTIMPAKPAKVPRPPNSFILYRQYHHNSVKSANPGIANNDISRIIGEKWRNECAEIKAHFKGLAEEMKRKHAIDHPEYQYAPRHPNERRRRISGRVKAAKLQFLAQDDEGAQFLDTEAVAEAGRIQVDERCLELLDKHDMMFGANGVEPFAVPDNGLQFDKIVNEQLEGLTTLETLVYDPALADELDAGFDFSQFVSDIY